MSEKLKEELKGEGFIILQTSWFILLIVGLIVSIGISIGVAQSQLSNHELRISKQEVWSKEFEVKQQSITEYRNRKLDEITYNLKAVAKKLNVDYQELFNH